MRPDDILAEWLRRRPAKPMGSPRVGSNPTGVVFSAPWPEQPLRLPRRGRQLGRCFSEALGTCGRAAMATASHAEGRQLDPGQVYNLQQNVVAIHPPMHQSGTFLKAFPGPRGRPDFKNAPQNVAHELVVIYSWRSN